MQFQRQALTAILEEKPVRTSPTEIPFEQQISHALHWDQIRAFAVRHQRLFET
jgi:hypothetical protein